MQNQNAMRVISQNTRYGINNLVVYASDKPATTSAVLSLLDFLTSLQKSMSCHCPT